MSNPFFSVIIPAHNSAMFIDRGLSSIKSQSFTDYEIVVVCDNCTDDTAAVAQRYGARVYNVSFGRDGLARDYGIKMSCGEWILFMDDDDWFLHEYCFQQLADKISECHGDIHMLAFGYVFRHKGYKSPHTQDELFTPRIAHVWSKAWRRDCIRDARFGDAVFCSDTYFLRDMKQNVYRYAILDMPIYYYNFMRPGSQTDKFVRGDIRESPVAE